jgi:three-Cys-motif partner protein
MRDLPALAPDNLLTPVVGDWAEEKYRLFACYAELFTTSMKGKWQHLVYVDLFAGPGRARIRGTKRIIQAPPLLALNLKYPFTRYIFSDWSAEKIDALRERVESDAPEADTHFICGDTNANVDEIIKLIPAPSRGNKVLTFCFADPYRLADLHFSTIKRLANARYADFLVLVPSGMDASRNRLAYLKAKSNRLDSFLGNSDWRNRWPDAMKRGQRFTEFVVDEFGRAMAGLGYRYEGIGSAHLMSSTARHLPIYHLLMLSTHPLGSDFWEKCRASSSPQRALF